jgi:hypothetical protein
MEKIIDDLKELGLPIQKVWYQNSPDGPTLQFEFTRPLTKDELEIFDTYRASL